MKVEDKIKQLLDQMTLEEKVSLCHGVGLFQTGEIERLGITPLKMSDGPMGVRREFLNDSWTAIGNSSDFVSYLPSNMALAATWSVDSSYEFGLTLGLEARGRGKDIILSPGINIIRSPLGGRNFEYMSEDPCLISEMVVPLIKGIQENDVAACVKHFAVNNHEHNRLKISVEVDEQALQEIYLPGFKAAITRGKSLSIMSAYNKLRGTYCSHNSYLLKDILRDQWGFDGIVVSDWGAVHDTKEAVNSGLDIEMRVENNFNEFFLADPYIQLLKSGEISQNTLDNQVSNILRVMFRLNKFSDNRKQGSFNNLNSWGKLLEIARESIVLLKNEENLLPLKSDIKKILVIGENADTVHSNGGGSAEIKALFEITPLLGLNMVTDGDCLIDYLPGYTNEESMKEAIYKAKDYEQIIVFCGLNHDHDREEFDRVEFNLPGFQNQLIDSLLDIKPNSIIVNSSGSPVAMPWINKAKALIQLFYSGMFSGQAVAEVLMGKINPSGKLPITFPVSLNESPDHKLGEFPGDEVVKYNEGIYVGYRYYEKFNVKTLFPFGFGLSYTTFEYSDLIIDGLSVRVNVKNSGNLKGSEIIQLYIKNLTTDEDRPIKELKAFTKVNLEPGEISTEIFNLQKENFAYFSLKKNKWVTDSGKYQIIVGTSVENILLDSIIIL